MPSLTTCQLIPAFMLGLISLAGCKTAVEIQPVKPPEPIADSPSESYVPVQRYGRYTLVELAPETAQKNLLLQVVDINFPTAWSVSVGDALRYVLLRSGYRLCNSTPHIAELLALPLPAAHLNLGPMVLRDALQILAGPGWTLQTDDRLRHICFVSSVDSSPLEASAIVASSTEAQP